MATDSPTLDNLLPYGSRTRWTAPRKATVVEAVRDGVITLQEACSRYSLSVEEFLTWQSTIERHGVPGLRATRLQIYRESDNARLVRRPSCI